MRVFFYSPECEERAMLFQTVVKTELPDTILETCTTLEELSRAFERIDNTISVAVLLLPTKEHLADIVRMRDLLSHIPLILIVPDMAENTVAIAHTFHPRFLTCVDNDFTESLAVLKNLLQKGRVQPGTHTSDSVLH